MKSFIDKILFGKANDNKEYYYIFNTKGNEYGQNCFSHEVCADHVLIGDVIING